MKLLRVLLILYLLNTPGCTTLGYYGQTIAGQMELLQKQQAVGSLLSDARISPELKQKLMDIQSILDYAHTELGLPDNGSYRRYAELGRDYIVWNVFAAPEFSLEPKQWCYLLIGCTTYRGYFRQQEADAYARTLQQTGWEVSVNGVKAYSTLGWLRDPLLSSMMHRDNWEIARLLFHELAHQVIYIPGDTEFNEAFADAVAGIGLRRWLADKHPDQTMTVRSALQKEESLYELLFEVRDRFDRLYQSGQPETVMRERKAQLHAELITEYQALKQRWNNDNRYDRWMNTGINNASLAALSTYRALVPAFESVFQAHDQDLTRLYKWAGQLVHCNREQRIEVLQHPAIVPACVN
jgi:predicted aminopeptidase